MTEAILASGRRVVVPENDLEEGVQLALMACLAPADDDRRRILGDAVYTGEGGFAAYSPDRFYWLEHVGDGRFTLVASDE